MMLSRLLLRRRTRRFQSLKMKSKLRKLILTNSSKKKDCLKEKMKRLLHLIAILISFNIS